MSEWFLHLFNVCMFGMLAYKFIFGIISVYRCLNYFVCACVTRTGCNVKDRKSRFIVKFCVLHSVELSNTWPCRKPDLWNRHENTVWTCRADKGSQQADGTQEIGILSFFPEAPAEIRYPISPAKSRHAPQ